MCRLYNTPAGCAQDRSFCAQQKRGWVFWGTCVASIPPALGNVRGKSQGTAILRCSHRAPGAAAAACFSFFCARDSVILEHLKGLLPFGKDLLFFYQNQTFSRNPRKPLMPLPPVIVPSRGSRQGQDPQGSHQGHWAWGSNMHERTEPSLCR